MKLPDYPQPRQPLEASWGKQVIDYLRSLTLTVGPGLERDWLPGGLTIRLAHRAPVSGGTEAATQPLQLEVTTDPADMSETPSPKIRVYASTIAGGSSTDIGFTEGDDPGFYLTPSVGVCIGGITVDQTSGEVTSRWIEIVADMPADTDDTFHVEIGTVGQDDDDNWVVSNSRYGPIGVTICRNWYAGSSPYFGVSFT